MERRGSTLKPPDMGREKAPISMARAGMWDVWPLGHTTLGTALSLYYPLTSMERWGSSDPPLRSATFRQANGWPNAE